MDILYNINPLILGVVGGVFASQISNLLYHSYSLLYDSELIEHARENKEYVLSFKKYVTEELNEGQDTRSAELIKLNKTIKSKLSEISSNINNHRGNYEKQECTYPTGIYSQQFHKQQKSEDTTYLCGSHPVTKLPFHCHQTVKCPTRLRRSRPPVPSEGAHLRERFLRDSDNKPALQATVRRHRSINPYHRDQYMRTLYTRKHPEQMYSERLEKTPE
jgi:hypothetical protein